jgi:glycosyltransferase involved in cell wall biosynthesis
VVTYQFVRACAAARVPCVFFAWQNLHKRVPQPFRAMRAYVFRHAQGAIAGTSQAAAVLRTAGCALPFAVIPQMGVDTDVFAPDTAARARVRARFGIPHDAFVAGYAGRLVPEKGVHVLIDALAALPDARLLVFGDGRERARLEAAATRALPGRATFAGHVASSAMPESLNALDALVLPSLRAAGWQEQFGRVLVEAMACGVPVIGSATGEIPRVIGDAGLIVPEGDRTALRDALELLAASPEHRCTLAGRSRQRAVESYTHARIAADTAAFYQTVLAA